MLQPKRLHRTSDHFVSAKARCPIPTRNELVLDALVQAAFDPGIRAIDFVPPQAVPAPPLDGTIVLIRTDGRFALEITGADPRPFAIRRTGGLERILLSEAEIRREPRLSNARLAWSYREQRVSVSMRLHIGQILSEDGPQRLGQLCAAIENFEDPAPAVMALACADLLEIDIAEEPIGLETMVRYRR